MSSCRDLSRFFFLHWASRWARIYLLLRDFTRASTIEYDVFTVSYLRSRGAPLISCNIWETHTVLFNLELFLAKARPSLATAPTRLYDLHLQLSFCMPCNRFRLSRESLVLKDRGPTASFQYIPVTFLGSYCPDGSTKSGRTRRREINHLSLRDSATIISKRTL
ncbi:hypothetical protein BC826DRAFT_556482 [Russula brevipes]|nr:hypothetical protein BC826DRAFT_556482 [Russula brevipes]